MEKRYVLLAATLATSTPVMAADDVQVIGNNPKKFNSTGRDNCWQYLYSNSTQENYNFSR